MLPINGLNCPIFRKETLIMANYKNQKGNRSSKSKRDFKTEGKKRNGSAGNYKANSGSQYGFNKFYRDLFNDSGDLGKSSNSFPFANVAGFPVNFKFESVTNLANTTSIQLPSIMVLRSVITPGYSADNSSALNVAGNKLFAEMRRYNTSVEVYDAVDVIQYILACDTAFAVHSYFASAYALLHNMDWSNRFIPRALCEARGFDYDDLAINQTKLRNILNTFRLQIGSLNVPNAFAFMDYHAKMYANVYKDADNFRAQMYSVIPEIYYQFVEGAANDEPGKLKPMPFPTVEGKRKMTVADIETVLNNIITPLMTSGSISLISGDMLKLTDFSMLQLEEVTDATVASPVYDEEFLRDLKNATVYLNAQPVDSTGIQHSTYDPTTRCYYIEQTPDVGGVKFQPIIKGLSIANDIIIDIAADLPSAEDFYLATRHTTLGTNAKKVSFTDPKTNKKFDYSIANPEIMGFDYYVGADVYSFDVTRNSAKRLDIGTLSYGVNDHSSGGIAGITTDFVIDVDMDTQKIDSVIIKQLLTKVITLSKFSAVPRINVIRRFNDETTPGQFDFIDVVNDIYNIAAIDSERLVDSANMTYLTAYSLTRK